MKEKHTVPISIIVPVYNVYEWIDECIQSIVDQTFRDFEVILINDGSTDQSNIKCMQWKERDDRIRYIDKENEGVFITRNLGLKEARGKYIIFVDSDDWLDLHYVEKLYNMALDTNADIVECDFWRFNNITGNKTYRPCYGHMEKEYSLEDHIIYGESVLWKYLSKKSFWIENDIVIPNCLGSAQVVYVLLLVLGAKIVNIHEPLYYYRRLRKGSILDINGKGTTEEGRMGLQELDVLVNEFIDRGLYEKCEEILERTVKYRLSDLLAAQFARKTSEEFEIQYKNYYKYIDEKFPKKRNNKYFIFGGYNLNKILSYLPEIQNPFYRFNFSSIISIMHPVDYIEDWEHNNQYRRKMIDRDLYASFWDILKEVRPKYVFLDFIEERFDVIKLKSGAFITQSDALVGSSIEHKDGIIIRRDSQECEEQWEKDCMDFYEKIIQYISAENIILVENYLSEEVGNIYSKRVYENIEEIRKTNCILKKYYDFFKENFKEVKCIEAYKCDYYFTDEKYEYGAVPSHLNEVVNKNIASKINEMLKNDM